MSTGIRASAIAVLSILSAACTPVYKPMGPTVTQPRIEGGHFIARDGVTLPVTVWGPRSQPEKVVIAAHSFGEFRDAFALIGEHLAEQNIAVWAYDQRGFGGAPHRGLWAGTDAMTGDFRDFTQAVRTEAGHDAPLILMGESMGAAVIIGAISAGGIERPNAMILSGPGVREDRPRRYWFNAGLWTATRVAASYEADVPRIYDDRLADYHARRWAEDPKIIDKVRLDTYYGLIRLSDFASEAASEIDTPTLVLFGTEDSQIHPKSICALSKRLGSKGTLKVFDGGPHLMFQAKDQDAVIDLIDTWVAAPGDGIADDSNRFCAAR